MSKNDGAPDCNHSRTKISHLGSGRKKIPIEICANRKCGKVLRVYS